MRHSVLLASALMLSPMVCLAQNSVPASYTAQLVPSVQLTNICTGINSQGQVVGSAPVPGSPSVQHAFFYDATSGVVDLGSLAGASCNSAAVGINATGQVVGTTDKGHRKGVAFITGPNAQCMTPIHAPSGTEFGCVGGVNDAGEVAGCVIDATNGVHVHDLGVLVAGDQSDAVAVNANGVVIGSPDTTSGVGQSFVTAPKGKPLVALAPRVTLPAGQTLASAVAINDNGQICANVRTGTAYQQLVYVLTPVAATAP